MGWREDSYKVSMGSNRIEVSHLQFVDGTILFLLHNKKLH